MYCKSCGLEIENDSKYCRRCGNTVTGDISGPHTQLGPETKKKISLVIGIAVALIIAAVTFFLLFTVDESPDAKSGISETVQLTA